MLDASSLKSFHVPYTESFVPDSLHKEEFSFSYTGRVPSKKAAVPIPIVLENITKTKGKFGYDLPTIRAIAIAAGYKKAATSKRDAIVLYLHGEGKPALNNLILEQNKRQF